MTQTHDNGPYGNLRRCHFCPVPIPDSEKAVRAKTGDVWAHFECWYDGGLPFDRDPATGEQMATKLTKLTEVSRMGNIERRYGIAGRAAGEAALEFGAGRKATDAFVLSRIARAVVDALDADDRGAVEALEEIRDGLHGYEELPIPRPVPPDIAFVIGVVDRALDRLGGR
jgi:hypothetical protein